MNDPSPRHDSSSAMRPAPSAPAPASAPGSFRLARAVSSAPPSRLRAILGRASRPGIISFAVGLPAEDLFPACDLAAAQARVLPASPGALQYSVPLAALKRRIVELMALRGVHCAAEQVFLTSGAQQGMDLLARLLLDPGDELLLEETVYEGAHVAMARQGARVLAVPTDLATGLDVSAVEAWLAHGARPRLLYTIPSGHNPLGVTLGAEKRRRLAALARDYELPVLEDDAYGFLQYDDVPEPPLRALEDRWVLYLGSFSKVLAPSLRVGWLVVPEELIPRLTALKHGTDIDSPSLTQHVITSYLQEGLLPAHLERLRAEYRRRRDAMLECLADSMPPGLRWTRPSSGMFIWLELPPALDASALLETAIETDAVAFSPGEAFTVGGGHASHCLRLSFASCPPDRIAEGIRRLATAVSRAIERCPQSR